MKNIPFMAIPIIILLTSFLAPIKVSSQRGGTVGGGGIPGIGIGRGGGFGFGRPPAGIGGGIGDDPKKPPGEVKPPEDVPTKTKIPPMPQECKPEVRQCINIYIYGGYGWPMYHGSCCLKLKYSVKCVCKFLKSNDPELRIGAKGVLKGCHYRLRKPCPN